MTDGFDTPTQVQIGSDCECDFFDDISKCLISFPFPRQASKCPRFYDLQLVFEGEKTRKFKSLLGVWREAPEYLARGDGGHLIVFFDAVEDFRPNFADLKCVIVEVSGPVVEGHELCDLRYFIS